MQPGDVFKLLRKRRYGLEDVYFVIVEPSYNMKRSWVIHQIGNIVADFNLRSWEREESLLNPIAYERVI